MNEWKGIEAVSAQDCSILAAFDEDKNVSSLKSNTASS
jgi:hypothetical protein